MELTAWAWASSSPWPRASSGSTSNRSIARALGQPMPGSCAGFPKLRWHGHSPSCGVPLADVAHSVLRIVGGEVRPWRLWIGRVFGGGKHRRANVRGCLRTPCQPSQTNSWQRCGLPVTYRRRHKRVGHPFHACEPQSQKSQVDNFFAYSRRGAVHTLQTLADACRGPGARLLCLYTKENRTLTLGPPGR